MILPGISGAFVLLVFGVYHPITGIIKDAAKLNFSSEGFLQLTVVALGCGFGLLAFSRLLRYLLEHRPSTTLAGLTGLMLGSAFKLWPLQQATAATASLKPKFRVMETFSPSTWEGTSTTILIALAVAAAIFVVIAETLSQRLSERHQKSDGQANKR
jgi:putative membrane protein